ncbi:MAG: tRNA epoxyqueuosine(34) reductase QueG [Fimbriimonadaceae bacterium]|nr:tRNA epoxyqueuosine(34) reductase QueG [Fimbriimonadaceae bacterium]
MADALGSNLIGTLDLKYQIHEAGFDMVGVTTAAPPESWPQFAEWVEQRKHGTMGYLARSLELRQDLNSVLPGVRSVVMVGLNYAPPRDEVAADPKIARYARGRDYHRVIPRRLKPVARWIEETFGAQTRIAVDSAPLLERDLAHRAGLGWFGKNTMLINSERGSWFLLGCLLTTVRFRPDEPAIGGCGTCRKCIDACPTGAIVHDNERWQVDARQCISYLTIEHRGELPEGTDTSGWLFGCDICQEVCPFNTLRPSQPLRARPTSVPDMQERRKWPTETEIASLSPESWDFLTRGSPVRRAGYEGLKRNARLAQND